MTHTGKYTLICTHEPRLARKNLIKAVTKDFIVIITLLKQSIELIEVNETVKNVEHAKGQRQQLPFHANV